MVLDPLRVACWRFEQIAPLLETSLTASEKHRMISEMARIPVRWPSGREEPVPKSTLYRWFHMYQRDPRIESLMPKAYDSVSDATTIQPEWIQYALALLEEEPARSFFVLTLRIRDHFKLEQAPARSTLHRTLEKEPRYHALRRRARGERRLRCRFQASEPHKIWHSDAKSEFTVTFTDGTKCRVKILTLLDDASRYALRSLIVSSESIRAAVATFRQAAARFGLPDKFYVDRGSAYDSDVFRRGLAILGVHRINTKPRNAPAHGKIEAFNRVITRWFVTELRHQPIRDLRHLQELLDAVIDELYHQHIHRELKQTPHQAFGNRISKRLVSLERLNEAFRVEKMLMPEKKTGTVRIGRELFRVPDEFLLPRRKVRIAIDPEDRYTPSVLLPGGGLVALKPGMREAGVRAEENTSPETREEPIGSLTPLLERYRGRTLPQARPGFGLPEIYQAFSKVLNREVPATESEATLIVDWLRRYGPFEPKAFHEALSKTLNHLGCGRPLSQILHDLKQQITHSSK
jgi:putative transposase